jgi:hypothetical protein
MALKTNKGMGAAFGLFGLVILGHLWFVLLAPVRWNIRYPGGLIAMFAAMIVAACLSIVAGRWGGADGIF